MNRYHHHPLYLLILIIFMSACQDIKKEPVTHNQPQSRVHGPSWTTPATVIGKRVALVIGNADYQFAPLKNPKNDAKDMATALQNLGFDVIHLENTSWEEMDNAIDTFEQKLGKGTVGLFYFSGHGVQFENINYLIPTDITELSVSRVKHRTISAGYVLTAMKAANNTMNIIILDACRDNPFQGYKGFTRGLARMGQVPTGTLIAYATSLPTGTLIAYATSSGDVAADGAGRNSPYTQAILKVIAQPGLPIELMFKRVRDAVVAETVGKQTPLELSSLQGEDFYFAGKDRSDEEARRLAEKKRQKALTLQKEQSSQGKVFKDSLKDGGLGPEMIWIPAGQFQMGDIQGGGDQDEKPIHQVSVKRFAIGRYEVTFTEYDRFAEATARKKPNDRGWGRGNRPVMNVSWHDAVAYAEWLSQQTGKPYRLPSEAEWEYAARAGTKTKYWWGNEIGKNQANCDGCGSQWDNKKTAPVGSFAPNPFGLYDMMGNAWEWVADPWHNNYKGAPSDGSVWEKESGSNRLQRGGSWINFPHSSRCANRKKLTTDNKNDNFGFRVAFF